MRTKQLKPTPPVRFAPFGKKIEHKIGFGTCPMKMEFNDVHRNDLMVLQKDSVSDTVWIEPSVKCEHCGSPLLMGGFPLPMNTIYRRDEVLLSGIRNN